VRHISASSSSSLGGKGAGIAKVTGATTNGATASAGTVEASGATFKLPTKSAAAAATAASRQAALSVQLGGGASSGKTDPLPRRQSVRRSMVAASASSSSAWGKEQPLSDVAVLDAPNSKRRRQSTVKSERVPDDHQRDDSEQKKALPREDGPVHSGKGLSKCRMTAMAMQPAPPSSPTDERYDQLLHLLAISKEEAASTTVDQLLDRLLERTIREYDCRSAELLDKFNVSIRQYTTAAASGN
jgi:hypothetical protein